MDLQELASVHIDHLHAFDRFCLVGLLGDEAGFGEDLQELVNGVDGCERGGCSSSRTNLCILHSTLKLISLEGL